MIECMKKAKNTPQRGNSYELYDCLSKELVDVLGSKVANVKQRVNLIRMVAGVIQGNTIALSQWVTYLPGETQAESRVTRVRWWLMNKHVDTWEWYRSVLEHVLKGWKGACLTVRVDGTMVFGDGLQIFRLSWVHGNRAIPLGWMVVPGKGLVKVEKLAAMFQQVATFLQPYGQQVIGLADRGFRDHDWAQLCVTVGWHYRIRITRNT
jgi:hypothetical protein